MKFAFIYALPGYTQPEKHIVSTDKATFVVAAVDFATRHEQTPLLAKQLVDEDQIDMLELCGGLADATIVAAVKLAIGPDVPVGAVYYGPESRQALVDIVTKAK